LKKVTLKVLDLRSIRLLFVFQIILLIFIVVVVSYIGIFNPGTYIFSLLFIVCLLIQIYLKNKGGCVIITSNSVEIISKKLNKKVTWNDVKGIYYNSIEYMFPELKQGTMDLFLFVDGEVYDVDSTLGNIKVNKKQYEEIVSIIPKECFEQNEFLIYRSLAEKIKYNKENLKK
jgi:hypothetical protein